jgi:hypothetical protein
MNIVQSIESAREEKVGSHGISADALKTALTRAVSTLVWIRAVHADRTLPLLRYPRGPRGDPKYRASVGGPRD